MNQEKNLLDPEDLAYWYFRLNGCLCLQNFLIHNQRGNEGTDADIIAVRFPYRRELAHTPEPMLDDDYFENCKKIDLMIVEVKRSNCALNGPWTDRHRENMQKALYAIGAFPEEKIDFIAMQLYQCFSFEDDAIRCRLISMGSYRVEGSSVVQITWEEIVKFIFGRFSKYGDYKTQHHQWDDTGQLLYRLANGYRRNEKKFVNIIFEKWGFPSTDGEMNSLPT